ncbi:unnamed protein product [Plutella xylostella]|uniref:(diamondback moth) hypothetical protein n=1 Tax=Plutella xylostella TaxID=51655 RepID=A0A8S4EZZ8_PLUXY|nr:unnamed protein product [Plutella xylostella]
MSESNIYIFLYNLFGEFLNLPYGCLESPYLEMMIMKSLGFSFEHNRKLRDLYIQVHLENVEPGESSIRNPDILQH